MSRRRARRLYCKALKMQRKADRHANAAELAYKRRHRHDEQAKHFEDLADRYDDLSREARIVTGARGATAPADSVFAQPYGADYRGDRA